MTAILGISAFYHDSAAALVVDGRIVAAAQQERFSRKKHDDSFPVEAIESCLEVGGISPEELDFVGFYDTRPYLWGATAGVAPIFTGSGMRVKVLETMASGAPVVGTGLSIHGLGAKPGEHLYLADDAAAFAAAVCRCIERPDEAAEVGENGRRLVRERHSSAASARAREGIWSRPWTRPGNGRGTPPAPRPCPAPPAETATLASLQFSSRSVASGRSCLEMWDLPTEGTAGVSGTEPRMPDRGKSRRFRQIRTRRTLVRNPG